MKLTKMPSHISPGVATLAGRKKHSKIGTENEQKLLQSLRWLQLQFMKQNHHQNWGRNQSRFEEESERTWRASWHDLDCVSCVWLPVPHHILFDFVRDETRRNEWDIMCKGSTVQTVANLAQGQDRGDAVTIMELKNNEHKMWVLQDSCTNTYESMVIYAPVEINGLQSVMIGCDSSNIAVLSSGFLIPPDGIELRPLVITSRPEEKSTEGGSLLTMAFQILISNSSTPKLC